MLSKIYSHQHQLCVCFTSTTKHGRKIPAQTFSISQLYANHTQYCDACPPNFEFYELVVLPTAQTRIMCAIIVAHRKCML